jgi:hypothetical protein
VLAAGYSALFDAVFAAESERRQIGAVAARVEARFDGLWLNAPGDVLKARVSGRAGDASDATAEVVDKQLGYDLGDMTWAEVDAGGTREDTLSAPGTRRSVYRPAARRAAAAPAAQKTATYSLRKPIWAAAATSRHSPTAVPPWSTMGRMIETMMAPGSASSPRRTRAVIGSRPITQ